MSEYLPAILMILISLGLVATSLWIAYETKKTKELVELAEKLQQSVKDI